MVVFDELPGHALMDANGRLDAEALSELRRARRGCDLVSERNQLREATPSSPCRPSRPGSTRRSTACATAADHPRSLFTLLGDEPRDARLGAVDEPLPRRPLRRAGRESTDEGGLGSILATIPSILGYVSVPDAKRLGIPSPRESGADRRGPARSGPSSRRSSPPTGPSSTSSTCSCPTRRGGTCHRASATRTRVGRTPRAWRAEMTGTTTSG